MKKIELPPRGLETLFGVHDQNIKYLESLLDVRVNARGQDVSIDGAPDDVETAERILEDFCALFKEGSQFTDKELREAFAQIAEDRAFSLRDYFTKARFNPSGKKQVAPKSATQRKYIQAESAWLATVVRPGRTVRNHRSIDVTLLGIGTVQISPRINQ